VRAQDIRIRIDASDLQRRVDRLRRDEERPPYGGKGSKLILGRPFIDALVKSGVVPKGTTYVRITADLDSAIRLDYETIGTSDLVAVADSIAETDSHEEAKAR
jgi:hypothetical protein